MSEVFSVPRVLHVVPGQVAVSANPDVTFTTILGASVAVCLYDPAAKLGGMAHFLFPDGLAYSPQDRRFCNQAISNLIAQIEEKAGNVRRVKVSLFGGAKIHDGRRDIGKRNAGSAVGFLARHDLSIVKQGLGGDQVRRIRFSPSTGACTERSMSDGLPHEALASYSGGGHA
ncbi:chemotaxis protein CheD [Pseudorhodobacter sp. W20_MBD10_FR17]|uniref:chemotaxis protein CheD n=1 Tax=Pseudorhodobacter sp. W20_MBD10_FR17 TaxID=3240266 RepID=UPI003F9B8621